jgi:CBS domain-containing protein
MLSVRAILQSKGAEIFQIGPDDTVFRALQEMAMRNCGALLVIDGGRPVGMISERDYARKVVLLRRASNTTRVRDVMDPHIVEVSIHLPVEKCMELMTDYRSRHLLVRDGDALAGVISIGDVVKALLYEQRSTIDHLTQYITSGG